MADGSRDCSSAIRDRQNASSSEWVIVPAGRGLVECIFFFVLCSGDASEMGDGMVGWIGCRSSEVGGNDGVSFLSTSRFYASCCRETFLGGTDPKANLTKPALDETEHVNASTKTAKTWKRTLD